MRKSCLLTLNVLLPKFRTNEILESIKECLETGTEMSSKVIQIIGARLTK